MDNRGGTATDISLSCPSCGSLLPPPRAGHGGIVLRATLPQHIAAALLRTPSLSPREMAVFELLGLGYDNRSLARVLHVSERTAKRHVTAILTKLHLESRLQAGLTALLTASLPPMDLGWPEGRMDHNGDLRCTEPGTQRPAGQEYCTMTFDALAALRAAGNPVDLLTSEQQAVFASLTEAEVAVLNSVKRRLDEVSDDEVVAHDIKLI